MALIVAVALLASLATPVFAQSFNPEFGDANVLAGRTQTQQDEGWNAMAQEPVTSRWTQTHSQVISNETNPGFQSEQTPYVDENY